MKTAEVCENGGRKVTVLTECTGHKIPKTDKQKRRL